MIITARKPSSDPVQEKLRESKSKWNTEVSAFIDNLIHLKKLMNGKPSKFYMQRATISQPLPKDPATILNKLINDYNGIVSGGNDIIAAQLAYSQTRKKKQVKAPLAPVIPIRSTTPAESAAPAVPDLSKQLAASSIFEEGQLISEGSNILSRFLSRLKGPWFGRSPAAVSRGFRLSMMSASVDLDNTIKKLHGEIVKSSPESIFTANRMLLSVEQQLYFLTTTAERYATYLDSKNPKAEKTESKPVDKPTDKPVETPKDKSIVQEAPVASPIVPPVPVAQKYASTLKLITDFENNFSNFSDRNMALSKQLHALIVQFRKAPAASKDITAEALANTYKMLLADLNNKRGTSANSLSEILVANLKKSSEKFELIAEAFVTRWLREKAHEASIWDKTSPLRLLIAGSAKEARKDINKLLNSLENQLEIEEVANYIKSLNEHIIAMRSSMKGLHVLISGKDFEASMINLLDSGRISQYDLGLTEKQKEKFQKMLETKRLQELTKGYS